MQARQIFRFVMRRDYKANHVYVYFGNFGRSGTNTAAARSSAATQAEAKGQTGDQGALRPQVRRTLDR